MASNLDYLDPALNPIEDKVNAYLEAEKTLSRVKMAIKNTPSRQPQAPATAQSGQQPAADDYQQEANDLRQDADNLQQEFTQLEHEIIEMLPTRNEWLKVDLGYGPSRVGAWHVPAFDGAPERYELRVVH